MKLPSLESYNRIIWAIVGTGVVAMVAIGLLTAAVKITGSLFDGPRAVPVAVVDDNGTEKPGAETAQYDFCQPITMPGSPYQLIRVASDRLVVRNVAVASKPVAEKGLGSSDDYSGSNHETCGFDGKDHPSAVVNVLVRNAETGAMHLALDESAVVYTLEYPTEPAADDPEAEDFPPKGVLFWEIASADSSGDGVIDEDDDLGAYLSDADGRNLKRITPVPSRLLERTYDKNRNVLLLRVLRDTNGDGKLDDEDQASLVESSVASRSMVREVLDKKTLSAYMREAEPKRQAAAAKN
jgi:hypothetical protein